MAFFCFHKPGRRKEHYFVRKCWNQVGRLAPAGCQRARVHPGRARIALIPHTTFFRRLVKPDNFTIGNLRDMFDALCLDAGDVLDIVAELLWEGGEAHG